MQSGILTMSSPAAHSDIPVGLAMKRGFIGHCPNCAETPLFKSYLKQVDSCSACGAHFGRIRADDAAPWLTIIAVGHFFLPLIFFVNLDALMPVWASVFAWSILFSGVSLALLPRAKGLFIALLWATRAPGVNNG